MIFNKENIYNLKKDISGIYFIENIINQYYLLYTKTIICQVQNSSPSKSKILDGVFFCVG